MITMNISLHAALKSFVDKQVAKRAYGTSSEYVRELIHEYLRGLLRDGAASAPASPAVTAYVDSLREACSRPSRRVSPKPIISRELANRDIDEVVERG